MAKNNISMPSGMGGLVRYFDEYKSSFSFSPGAVLIIAVLIMVVEIVLHTMGNSWLGI